MENKKTITIIIPREMDEKMILVMADMEIRRYLTKIETDKQPNVEDAVTSKMEELKKVSPIKKEVK